LKKIERRAIVCLFLAGLLTLGLGIFIVRFFLDGSDWASAAFNRHIYNSAGQLDSGTILDRNGSVLSSVANGQRTYCDGANRRKSILHVVGDPSGNIGTGALTVFADKLSGYNPIFGASGTNQGNKVYLTIDADYNETAYKALNGKKGTVAVYNYKTGEILCLVSSPSYDPNNIPSDLETNPDYTGAYINRFFSSTFTPGSIFKTVTLAAALEKINNLYDRTWTCEGSLQIGDDKITCEAAHGKQDITAALANSCNVVFGQLANELGSDTLKSYTEKAGLTKSYQVNGIPCAAGTFDFDNISENQLAWAGVGQYHDSVNPCSMMIYMGAIASGGKAAIPTMLLKSTTGTGIQTSLQLTQKSGTLIEVSTAKKLADMMANDVVATYGKSRFPNMDICAKTGTAEVSSDQKPNSWFVGFLRDEDHPYAFVALVENGGSGSSVAGTVASKVLNAMVNGT
jgi:cell division protein FtsI/penicillin-binding protein 2